MACSNILSWKKGYDLGTLKVGSLKLPLNYFSCGKYYFDGDFNVVEFPAGVSIYHGSKPLPKANVRFPAGIPFYTPHRFGTRSDVPDITREVVANPDASVEEVLSGYTPVAPVWFANPQTSMMYAKSPNNMFAYKFKKVSKFLLLDDNFNIAKILFEKAVPPDVKRYLRLMFTLPVNVTVKPSSTEYGKIQFMAGETPIEKVRKSVFSWDRAFANWLCKTFPDSYVGYCANVHVVGGKPSFHLEFMSCNPFTHIERDLGNIVDWQYNLLYSTPSPPGDILHQYIEQMSYYTSTNVDFHSGNLLEHAVWCLLFSEYLMKKPIGKIYEVENNDLKKVISAASFIHDIGKMAPRECTRRKKDLVYFSIKNHPQIGKDYVNGTNRLPILSKDMKETGTFFDVKKLMRSLGIAETDFGTVADLVGHHWDFGPYLAKYIQGDRNSAQKFINFIGRERTFEYFYALLIVSMADVMSAQPFIAKNSSGKNAKSEFFPAITNLPKRYRGSNLAVMQAVAREEFATLILNLVHQDKFGRTPHQRVSFETIKMVGGNMKRELLDNLERMDVDNMNDIAKEEEEAVKKQQELFAMRRQNQEKKSKLLQELKIIEGEEDVIMGELDSIVDDIEMIEINRELDKIKMLVENMAVEIPDELMDYEDSPPERMIF